ncbi:hypothetical protein B0A48_16091 [Cryoendolithus antarcticus]|uniref:Uncharacterized protein n=1 Tax=Cryoendolithus antarcticus TaxID=1507870 RepID=A0A1V8SFL2_9PEZI|nr:hypothetical protein B0A48_16091 [Cryoendolithus antarcticus]
MARLKLNGFQRALVALLAALALCLLTGPITFRDLYQGSDTNEEASLSLYSAFARSKTPAQALRRADNSGSEDSNSDEDETELPAPVEFKLTEEEKTTAYHDYGCRGAKLLGILRDSAKHTPSSWIHFSGISSWGWRINAESTAQGAPVREYGLNNVLDSIGASEAEPPNNNIRWVHDIRTTHSDGARDVAYPATGAYYEDICNVRDGVIIAYDIVGPRFRVMGRTEGEVPADRPLPKLAQWSDVVWLTWVNLTTDATRGGLKHVIHTGVLNQYSVAIAEMAVMSMGNANGRLKNFPGHKFTQSNDREAQAAFEALVGSPNVSGTAWLLIQHFRAVGKKAIKSVSIWNADPMPAVLKLTEMGNWNENMNLLIELAPLEDAEHTRRRSRL